MSYWKIEVQLLVILFTMIIHHSEAQTPQWQIGIGMSPGEEIFDPWYLIMKRRLNARWNLRSGLGFSSRKYEEEVYSRNVLRFNYVKITSEYDIRFFSGLEHRMKWRGLEFFAAADLLLDRSRNYERLKDIYFINTDLVDPHSQFYDVAQFDKVKVFSVGGRFAFGIEYFITRNASVVVESGLSYRYNYHAADRVSTHLLIRDLDLQPPIDEVFSIYQAGGVFEKSKTDDLYFGLISLLTFQYHF